MGLVNQPTPGISFSVGDYESDWVPRKGTKFESLEAVSRDYKLTEESLFQKQLHLPGYNYAGPGTRIKSNILHGIKPVDAFDAAALIHDVEYLSGQYSKADDNMIGNLIKAKSAWTIPSEVAFTVKDYIGYEPTPNAKDYLAAREVVKNTGLLEPYPGLEFSPEVAIAAEAAALEQP